MPHLIRPKRPTRLALISYCLALGACFPVFLQGQAGDRKDQPGTVQREIWRQIDPPPAPVLSPEQALAAFDLEPGFRLELVAAEPLVNDPVAVAWDADGRLWVTEFWSYMPNVDGEGEDAPRGRVVVLEDLDGDGQMDKSTVFLDQLVLPRAIAIVEGGVLIADPPSLFYCQDHDQDLVCDSKVRIGEYAATGNVEHAENGLMRGIDNWLYNAKSERRLKFQNGTLVEDQTLFRGQWGIAQDDYGRLYYNHNSYPLYVDAIPFDTASRHPGWQPKAGFELEATRDASFFPVRVNPGINRAYRPDWLAPDHRMKRADAASAPTVYRGTRYPPEYRGDAFVPEPAGNLVAAYQLHDDGLGVYGAQRIHRHPHWGAVSFIASSDERFRPVAVANGPDGYLYVVDMYRGIIQHKTYLTTFLRKQIIERGLDEPVGLGRIYRLVHESDPARTSSPKLSTASDSELVAMLADENGWTRDTAQRLLTERSPIEPAALAALKELARSGPEIPRIHALWTLADLNELEAETLLAAGPDSTPWVQAHALRAGAPLLAGLPRNHPLLDRYREALSSPDRRVQLHALYALPLIAPPAQRAKLIAGLDPQRFADPYILDAAIAALYQAEGEAVKAIGEQQKEFSDGLALLISGLAEAAFNIGDDPTLLAGLGEQASVANWAAKAFRERIQQLESAKQEISLDRYSKSEVELIEAGRPLYQQYCGVCHQDDGQGAANLAPPVAGSEWVLGSKERLARVVAHGLEGPIEVKGQAWDSVMPGHGQLPALDEPKEMAALLSYLRAAWGNQAEVISPSEVFDALAPHAERTTPWTAEELESAP